MCVCGGGGVGVKVYTANCSTPVQLSVKWGPHYAQYATVTVV